VRAREHVQPGRLSGIDMARVVKKLADRTGLDAVKYAGHPLRAGHATSAARNPNAHYILRRFRTNPGRLAKFERKEVRSVPFADMTNLDDLWLSLSASYHCLVRHDTPTKTCI
jgi:hypothetical protein